MMWNIKIYPWINVIFRHPDGVHSGMLPLLCKTSSQVFVDVWIVNPWKLNIHVNIYRSPFAPAPEFEPLCSRFDGSDNFLMNCTQSTFCMTRTYRLHLRQGDGSHHEFWKCSFVKLNRIDLHCFMIIFCRQSRRGDQRERLRPAGVHIPEPGARPVEDRDLGDGGDLRPRLPRGHGVGRSAGHRDPVVLLWHRQVRHNSVHVKSVPDKLWCCALLI